MLQLIGLKMRHDYIVIVSIAVLFQKIQEKFLLAMVDEKICMGGSPDTLYKRIIDPHLIRTQFIDKKKNIDL